MTRPKDCQQKNLTLRGSRLSRHPSSPPGTAEAGPPPPPPRPGGRTRQRGGTARCPFPSLRLSRYVHRVYLLQFCKHKQIAVSLTHVLLQDLQLLLRPDRHQGGGLVAAQL